MGGFYSRAEMLRLTHRAGSGPGPCSTGSGQLQLCKTSLTTSPSALCNERQRLKLPGPGSPLRGAEGVWEAELTHTGGGHCSQITCGGTLPAWPRSE